jgi:hypothetical protein
VNQVPVWRKAAGAAVLAAMAFFLAIFAPIYYHNFQLRNYVDTLTHSAESRTASDDILRSQVVDKAHQLNLFSIKADDVHVLHSENDLRIEVRYRVPVNLPGYTVMLHFYPGAGSR